MLRGMCRIKKTDKTHNEQSENRKKRHPLQITLRVGHIARRILDGND